MKRVILATVAATCLCLPALAQQSTSPTPTSQSQSAMPSSSQGDAISPQKLNSQQIRQLQQSLNDKGFSVGAVDSEWGPRTEDALKKFQESKQMPSSGELNQGTISALGLNGSDFGLNGSSQTTGQAPSGNNNSRQPQENNDTTKGTSPTPAH
jgi:peptidoglycan hydrolase-like protein with peptidoglycan-binding domain